MIKDEKVTYSNSSLKLWKDRKYTSELAPVKIYKKVLVFFVAKIVKDITNYLLKQAKALSQ